MAKYKKKKDILAIIDIILYPVLIIIVIFIAIYKANASDLGVIGKSWDITEKNILSEIESKLRNMQASGEIADHQAKITEKVKRSALYPEAVKNIKHTQKPRSFTYDPVYTVAQDLKDNKGQIFAKKGDKVNPFDYVSLNYELIFLDGNDEDHVKWAITRYQEAGIKPKLILVSGSPIELENEYDIDFYFDQSGVLTLKLGIEQVPALVYQKGKKLEIKEFDLKLWGKR